MNSHHKHLQAHSHLKAPTGNPHQQNHIHFQHPARDRHHVSDGSFRLLHKIIQKVGVASVTITSTVRNAHQQVSAMLGNIEKGKHVNYSPPGKLVQISGQLPLITNALHSGPFVPESQIYHGMVNVINDQGLSRVTNHAPHAGGDTIDFVITGSASKQQRAALISEIKNLVVQGQIGKFGWPEGPKGGGKLFRDGGCFHVEIPHAKSIDAERHH